MATAVTTDGNNTLFGPRHVVRTSTGDLYAVAEADASVRVFYSADGSSWAEKDAGNAPACMADSPVAVAIDSADILHIVYYESGYPAAGNGLQYVTFDTLDGGAQDDAFNTPEECMPQEDADNTTYGCAIAIDSNDIPHACFVDSDAGKGTDYDTIYYANRTGGAWDGPTEVQGVSLSDYCNYPDMCIDLDDKPVISYLNTGDNEVRVAQGTTNDASAFSLVTVDADASQTAGEKVTSICVDSGGNHYVAFEDHGDGLIYLRKHAYGVSWGIWVARSTGSDAGINPSVVADGLDIYVFYEDPAASDTWYEKVTGGSTWEGDSQLDAGDYNTIRAKWACWVDNSSGGRGIKQYSPYTAADAVALTGDGSALSERLANSFQFPKDITITRVTLKLRKVVAPVDNLEISIRDARDGNVLGSTASIGGGSLTTTFAYYDFDVGSAALTANTTYYLQLQRDGGEDAVNYYQANRNSNEYANGSFWYRTDPGGWAENATVDISFLLWRSVSEIDYVFMDETGSPDILYGSVSFGPPPAGQPTQVRTWGVPTASGRRDRAGGWN